MKKIFIALLAVAGLVGGVACNNDNPTSGKDVIADLKVDAKYTIGSYFPRSFTTESGVVLDAYSILFTPTEAEEPYYNPSPSGAGVNLFLTFYNKTNDGVLLAGTYKIVDNSVNQNAIKAKTIAGALSSVVTTDAAGEPLAGAQNLISGEAIVTVTGESYEITVNALTTNKEEVVMTFSGVIPACKMAPQSTLKADKTVNLAGFTGESNTAAFNYASNFISDGNDLWVLNVYSGAKGTDGIQIWLNVPAGQSSLSKGVPAGTYIVSKETTTTSISCIAGELDAKTGQLPGSWYIAFLDNEKVVSDGAPATSGQVVISRESNTYTVTFEFKDDFAAADQHTVKGTWTGVPVLANVKQ